MIPPRVAAVRPRIVSPATGDALLLEDFILTVAAKHSCGSIHLGGPPGSGKSTALSHLAATILPHFSVLLLDEPELEEVAVQSMHRLVVYTHQTPIASRWNRVLARWSDDDLIEYLLTLHGEKANDIFGRFRQAPDRSHSQGLPELVTEVIERMAVDESIDSLADAFRLAIREAADALGDRTLAFQYCQSYLHQPLSPGDSLVQQWKDLLSKSSIPSDSKLARLLGFDSVREVLTTDFIFDELAQQARTKNLTRMLPRTVVASVGSRAASEPNVIAHLVRLANAHIGVTPMAASILRSANATWVPKCANVRLNGAYLSGACWRHAVLCNADLRRADLSDSDLFAADLEDARLDSANLESSCLERTNLTNARFIKARLAGASFAGAKGDNVRFGKADLSNTDFRGSDLHDATFRKSCLRDANFSGANLERALITNCRVANADFRNVYFRNACFENVRLGKASLDGAVFAHADLRHCDLEYAQILNANFHHAKMARSYLTGSKMHHADLRAVDLTAAGLGEVDWQGSDLRDADFRECSFHLGSTRCGMVDSPYPSEGTRTGFYTDDYDDQYFKSPEEIRKANLRGCNLLGAKVFATDFYLVDLRDAQYDDAQRKHFMRTGAILHTRRCG